MRAAQPQGITDQDPCFAVLFAAVSMILAGKKPAQRTKLIAALLRASDIPTEPAHSITPSARRGYECLEMAVRHWCAMKRVTI